MNIHKSIFVVCAFIIFLSPLVVFAQWSGPTQAPTGGNTAAPINVGSVTQSKLGALTLGSLGVTGGATVNGNVGIGTASPGYKLHVIGDIYANGGWLRTSGTAGWYNESYGGGWYMQDATWIRSYNSKPVYMSAGLDTGAASGIGCGGGLGGGYMLQVCGSTGAMAFYYTSDESLKKNIQPLSDSLDKVLHLEGVSFDWKKDDARSIGVIAQDVEKVYPELVKTDEKTGLKSVEYGNLIAPLIEAIKEQQQQIDELRAEIHSLKSSR
jgi:hypothetical protein